MGIKNFSRQDALVAGVIWTELVGAPECEINLLWSRGRRELCVDLDFTLWADF